jgi:hypothetical protein
MLSPVHGIMPLSGRNYTYHSCSDYPSRLWRPSLLGLIVVTSLYMGTQRNFFLNRRALPFQVERNLARLGQAMFASILVAVERRLSQHLIVWSKRSVIDNAGIHGINRRQ